MIALVDRWVPHVFLAALCAGLGAANASRPCTAASGTRSSSVSASDTIRNARPDGA